MILSDWLSNNYIEVFGALTGIIYVFMEIRQTIWLWPLGIITSTVYILVFFTSKFYADMSLQAYYVVISVLGWFWWMRGAGLRKHIAGQNEESTKHKGKGEIEGQCDEIPQSGKGIKGEEIGGRSGEGDKATLQVTRLKMRTGMVLLVTFILLYFIMWKILCRLTDSPVPEWDSFLTSLSIIATWMLARKIYEHWLLWIVVNIVSVIIYFTRGLYPTVALYAVYAFMSFIGLKAWKSTIRDKNNSQ